MPVLPTGDKLSLTFVINKADSPVKVGSIYFHMLLLQPRQRLFGGKVKAVAIAGGDQAISGEAQ